MLGIGSALSALAARFNGLSGPEVKAMVRAAAESRTRTTVLRGGGAGGGGPKMRRAVYHDRSRYTGAMLRAIRAERGCGRPPKVLAARRARREMLAELRAEADLRAAHTSHKAGA
ncbi:hypothetical protein [Xanthobacter flavus]|uniref:hypothetical protein n=1 Tax=Xanthobacter flavus TaxID=281 RepID=UPI001AE639C2|nr:hypothetical protein [Xanthobacter flavus]MBP2147961.1 hypothetical protein [Xanthobacter flavus]